jgi:rhodanese-related sulfurtransferase
MDTKLIIDILIGAFLVWFIYSRFAGVKGLKILKADEFQKELHSNKNNMLIDVREPFEVKQGYILGAVNIPLSQLKNRVGEISKDKQVYLYCRSGMRSKQAAKILKKSGIPELTHLQGGISSWQGKLAK